MKKTVSEDVKLSCEGNFLTSSIHIYSTKTKLKGQR